jgi:hypothetical protein
LAGADVGIGGAGDGELPGAVALGPGDLAGATAGADETGAEVLETLAGAGAGVAVLAGAGAGVAGDDVAGLDGAGTLVADGLDVAEEDPAGLIPRIELATLVRIVRIVEYSAGVISL